ncbi:MAG: NADH-quinone oxidoreductase subunit M [Pirellulaceae bacterium]|jgi:NADH-quinone oxidoreductase subunit M|nr:NADH-quinone oxidoreductase subunit M [Pirellulaceae bacterium]MDP7014459.1 NADH-quinone oxidoreductase subunit M [Pirellulaceae bacterium]
MDNVELSITSLIVFLPCLGAFILAFFPKNSVEGIRYFTLGVTIAVLLLTVIAFIMPPESIAELKFARSGEDSQYMQNVFNVSWIPSFDIYYSMGMDGISFPLILLTALVSALAMGASWSITEHVKGYCILFLLLLTGMIGVFLALDFFLFYVFWEVMLLPMYFLIGVWGGPRREYAAIKFFLYTLVGSVLMLIAILMLYFGSDLRELAKKSDLYGDSSAEVQWDRLHVHPNVTARLRGVSTVRRQYEADGAVIEVSALDILRTKHTANKWVAVNFRTGENTAAAYDDEAGELLVTVAADATVQQVADAINSNPLTNTVVTAKVAEHDELADPAVLANTVVTTDDSIVVDNNPVHTFNLLALAGLGQKTDVFPPWVQSLAFVLLFIGFAIKVPAVPVHTWLPDAHVEAPTPISMILAGVLLKMGGYGIIRICYPICPHGGYDWAGWVCAIGLISMVYGAFAALAQKDFKRLVAYSSVSHMGYVVLGLGVWSATKPYYNSDYWNLGVQGAMFQMIGHGISSAGMFFMVGIVYDRVHHRNLNEFGGIIGKMPFYTAMAIGLFFAGLGLPGLCGFIGEVFVVLSIWAYSKILAVIAASVVILTAAYILWALQRVYLGAEYHGPHEEALTPTNLREKVIGVTLLTFAIALGVAPYHTVLDFMDDTIERQTIELTDWTKNVKEVDRFDDEKADDDDDDDAEADPADEDVADAARGEPLAQKDPLASER